LKRAGVDWFVAVVGGLAAVSGATLVATGSFAGLYTLAFGIVLITSSVWRLRRGRTDRGDDVRVPTLQGERTAFLGAIGFAIAGVVFLALGIDAFRQGGNFLRGLITTVGGVGSLLFGISGVIGISIARRRRRGNGTT
jgi:hypothetical protein